MAERLKSIALLALLPFAAWPAAHAQSGLSDPTRPPSVLQGAGHDGDSSADAPAQHLQSILISPHRRFAVIDGVTVQLGGKFNGATLVQVAETHVTLKQGSELKTLEMFPGIGRKAVRMGQDAEKKKGTSQ